MRRRWSIGARRALFRDRRVVGRSGCAGAWRLALYSSRFTTLSLRTGGGSGRGIVDMRPVCRRGVTGQDRHPRVGGLWWVEMTHQRGRLLLAAIFATSGIMHFVAPEPFVRIVPPFLPRPDLMVAISGVAEVAGAIGLLVPATRRLAGWGLIALLVAVFPANIQMLLDARSQGEPLWWQAALALRLPLQPILIWLVWRSCKATPDAAHAA